MRLIKMMELCKKVYDDSTFNHCMRVAMNAISNCPDEDKEETMLYALAHEMKLTNEVGSDTICYIVDSLRNKITTDRINNSMIRLNETHLEHVRRLNETDDFISRNIKRADLKDSLLYASSEEEFASITNAIIELI